MKDLAVVTSVTEKKGMLGLLEQQLNNAGIDFYIDSRDGLDNGDMFTFCEVSNRLNVLHDVVTSLNDYKNIVIVDGWDTLFFGTKEEIINNIPKEHVLIAAEKMCYPNCSIQDEIPDGGTPWKFANFGGLAGTRDNLLEFIEECKQNMHLAKIGLDQEVLNEMLAQGINSTFELDYNTQMFYCMMEDEGELVNFNQRPLDTVTDQLPNFIHFNGKVDSLHFFKEYGMFISKPPRVDAKVDFVFCVPGNPSSGLQSGTLLGCIVELMKIGKNVLIRSGFANNIYHVRNICLANKSFELDQVPFEDYCADYDKIVWVDSDNLIKASDVLKLSSHDVDIVAGWYSMAPRETGLLGPYNKVACGLFGDVNKPWTRRPYLLGLMPFIKRNEMGLIPAHYTGFGLTVIKKGVFEAIGFPWFESWKQIYQIQNFKMCEVVTDDDGFCQKAMKKGFKIWIDPEVRIGHEKLIIH